MVIFQEDGTWLTEQDRLNRRVKTGVYSGAHVSCTVAEISSGPLDFLTSKKISTRRTSRCVKHNISSIILLNCEMVSSGHSPSSRVDFDANREHRRSAFSFSECACVLCCLRKVGRDDRQKFPSPALAKAQKAHDLDGKLRSLSSMLRICSSFTLIIEVLQNLEAA